MYCDLCPNGQCACQERGGYLYGKVCDGTLRLLFMTPSAAANYHGSCTDYLRIWFEVSPKFDNPLQDTYGDFTQGLFV